MDKHLTLQQLEQQPDSHARPCSSTGDTTVRSAPQNVALIERYLNLRATRLSRNTIAAYRADLLHFASTLGSTSLLAVIPDDIALWFRVHSRTEEDPDDRRPWSARTAHRRRAALSQFYNWARRQELLRRNPLDEIELPRYHRKPPLVIESDQIERVFAHAQDCIRHGNRRVAQVYVLDVAVLQLMERLALRVSEAVGIRLSRVTSVGNELHAWIVKKGNKPKTYPLTGLVLEAYTRWLDLRRAVQPTSVWSHRTPR